MHRCLCVSVLKLCILFLVFSVRAFAQTPAAPAMERVTFEEAIQRALANNPTIAGAAEAVLRAEGLLQQARAATRPGVNAFVTNSTLDTGRSFNGVVIQPRNQTAVSADLSMPVLAAARWAATTQARDQVEVANLVTAVGAGAPGLRAATPCPRRRHAPERAARRAGSRRR